VLVWRYRIELAEVEITLQSYPAIEQAVVVVREGQLVAYVKANPGSGFTPKDIPLLEAHAAKSLTSYMIPKYVLLLVFLYI